MEQKYSLSRPELLAVFEGKRNRHGADYRWFGEESQRRGGCAPAAAATVLSYLAQTRPSCRPAYPSGSHYQADMLKLMEGLRGHITPGWTGSTSLHRFSKGFASFLEEKSVCLPLRTLDIPRFRPARPTASQCAAFLRTALAADSPVLWLSHHPGEVKELGQCRWVVLTAIEQHSDGALLCTVLHEGRKLTVDFRLWFQTTRAGGGLAAPAGVDTCGV